MGTLVGIWLAVRWAVRAGFTEDDTFSVAMWGVIGAIVATEFAMASEYPESRFVENALVFAPGKTPIESLRGYDRWRTFRDGAAKTVVVFTPAASGTSDRARR